MIPKRFTRKRKLRLPIDGLEEEPGPVVIAGGSGFLGRALANSLLERRYDVVILSRHAAPDYGHFRTVVWDGRTVDDWGMVLDGASALVNLTGRSVACLDTPENRREIIESRVNSTRALLEACSMCSEPPPVMVQASSLAIYGDSGDQVCDESTPHGTGYSVEVCEQWEDALFHDFLGPRRVALRIGFVIGRDGGALKPLATLARSFLGGSAGSGRQFISWVDIDDFCGMVRWAMLTPDAEGAYNATGANPVTNAEFMKVLRRAVRRPWSPPVPEWAVKFGARYIMHVDPKLILTGRRCMPKRLLDEGFLMKHTDLYLTLRQQLWVPQY